MCRSCHQVYHSQLIDFDLQTHFVQFYLKIASYLLTWGNKNVTLGMGLLWNAYENQNWYTRNTCRYIFCYSFQSIVTLKLKFWDYSEQNMGFHLTQKSTTSAWALGDENAMATSCFNMFKINCESSITTFNHHYIIPLNHVISKCLSQWLNAQKH